MNARLVRRVFGTVILPLALSLGSGCAAIQAQKLAGDGNRLVESDKPDEAIQKFEESIKTRDNDVAHAGLAEAYLAKGDYKKAFEEAEKAVEMTNDTVPKYQLIAARALLLQGQGPDAYERATKVLNRMATQMSDPISKATAKEAILLRMRIIEATGVPDGVLKLLDDDEVQARWPDDFDFRAERAITMALKGQYDEALKLAESVLKQSDDGDALLAKGMVLAAQGKSAEAREILRPALRADHTRSMVILNEVRRLKKEKKIDDAVALLKLLAEVQPTNHLVHTELAFIYLDRDKIDDAIQEHQLALKYYAALKPYVEAETPEALAALLKEKPLAEYDRVNLAGLYDNLNYLYTKKGMKKKALVFLERSAVVIPKLSTYQNLAAAYTRMGDKEKAIEVLEAAHKLEPDNPDVMSALGTLYFQTKQVDKAEEFFTAAIKRNGDDPDLRMNLGVVYYNSKAFDKAKDQFKVITKLDPSRADAWYNLGIAQMKLKDYKGAEQSLLKAVEIKPDYVEAYRELSTAALKQQKVKAAKRYYKLEQKYSK